MNALATHIPAAPFHNPFEPFNAAIDHAIQIGDLPSALRVKWERLTSLQGGSLKSKQQTIDLAFDTLIDFENTLFELEHATLRQSPELCHRMETLLSRLQIARAIFQYHGIRP